MRGYAKGKHMKTVPSKSNTTAETTANGYTKVSSEEGSKLTRNATEDIDSMLNETEHKNYYVISAQWEGKKLTLDALFFGDDTTRAKLSVYDIVNNRTIGYAPVIASSMKEVSDFATSSINQSAGTTVYIVVASRDSQPQYQFMALGSPLNTDIIKEVPYDCSDSLYYLATNKACFDFITAEFVMSA